MRFKYEKYCILAVMVHTFNTSTQEAQQVDLCELKASLHYRGSSRPARDMKRDPILKEERIGGKKEGKNCYSILKMVLILDPIKVVY